MTDVRGGGRKYIVYRAIREYVDSREGDVRPGTAEYADLMQAIEGQVQRLIREHEGGSE